MFGRYTIKEWRSVPFATNLYQRRVSAKWDDSTPSIIRLCILMPATGIRSGADFGLPSSPNLPLRGTDSCGNWYCAFAVEFCCDTKSSVFPRPNGNIRDAIPWNPCAKSCEQMGETRTNAHPISYSK